MSIITNIETNKENLHFKQKDPYLQKELEVILAQREVFHQVVSSVSQCEALSNFLSFPILPQL